MFVKLRLKQRMYLQFFFAVLPLAIVFSFKCYQPTICRQELTKY